MVDGVADDAFGASEGVVAGGSAAGPNSDEGHQTLCQTANPIGHPVADGGIYGAGGGRRRQPQRQRRSPYRPAHARLHTGRPKSCTLLIRPIKIRF